MIIFFTSETIVKGLISYYSLEGNQNFVSRCEQLSQPLLTYSTVFKKTNEVR